MTFNPKALLVFLAFAGVVLLAVSARSGRISGELAIAGVIAFTVIELLLTPLGYALLRRGDRDDPHVARSVPPAA
jgi:hypothetical protein